MQIRAVKFNYCINDDQRDGGRREGTKIGKMGREVQEMSTEILYGKLNMKKK
jgi:hypothetical protein